MSKRSEREHAFHKASHQDRTDAVANHSDALEEVAEMEPKGGPLTTFLKGEKARHEVMLAHHADQMRECSKSMDDELIEKRNSDLVPSRVSAVAPERPRMIPRYGAPEVPVPVVDPQFARVFSTETE
jgi:hypothetical protein